MNMFKKILTCNMRIILEVKFLKCEIEARKITGVNEFNDRES